MNGGEIQTCKHKEVDLYVCGGCVCVCVGGG